MLAPQNPDKAAALAWEALPEEDRAEAAHMLETQLAELEALEHQAESTKKDA